MSEHAPGRTRGDVLVRVCSRRTLFGGTRFWAVMEVRGVPVAESYKSEHLLAAQGYASIMEKGTEGSEP